MPITWVTRALRRKVLSGLSELQRAQIDPLRLEVGALLSKQNSGRTFSSLREAEFTVFSQAGEDGIIQYLIQRVPIEGETFVEIGVGDYREANTRFLAMHDYWGGLIIDAEDGHRRFVRQAGLDVVRQIDARTALVTRDNVNALLRAAGVTGDIGLLSVDIDGIDYWVIEALEAIRPRIIVAEYNTLFGTEASVTVPYDARFDRFASHYSNGYFGASIRALTGLAERKGYALVGGNTFGTNVFFVREDLVERSGLRPVAPEIAWAPARFQESRGPTGGFTFIRDPRERLSLIRHLPVRDLEAPRTVSVGERFQV